MLETDLLKRFKKKLDVRVPSAKFYYKIPDTRELGGKKPFDSFLVVRGMFFAIEAKVKDRKVTPYQKYNLELVAASGGLPIELTEKNIDAVIELIQKAVRIKQLSTEIAKQTK